MREITIRNDTESPEGLVLVTGASGFIGDYVCARWSEMGVPVRGLYRIGLTSYGYSTWRRFAMSGSPSAVNYLGSYARISTT